MKSNTISYSSSRSWLHIQVFFIYQKMIFGDSKCTNKYSINFRSSLKMEDVLHKLFMVIVTKYNRSENIWISWNVSKNSTTLHILVIARKLLIYRFQFFLVMQRVIFMLVITIDILRIIVLHFIDDILPKICQRAVEDKLNRYHWGHSNDVVLGKKIVRFKL